MTTLFKLLAGVAFVAVLAVSPHAQAEQNKTVFQTAVVGTINNDSMFALNTMLKIAKLGDTIEVLIDSPGGRTYPTVDTIRLMNQTHAVVVCYIPRYAASAAAHLASSCDIAYAAPTAKIMYHQSYYHTRNGKVRTADTVETDIDMQLRYNLSSVIKERSIEYLQGKDVTISGQQFNQNHIQSRKR
jgi:ATP-dependent protease ClpP protease subunit